jgi:hypothetical protein
MESRLKKKKEHTKIEGRLGRGREPVKGWTRECNGSEYNETILDIYVKIL